MAAAELAQQRGEFFVTGRRAQLYVLRVGVFNQGEGQGGFVQEGYEFFPIDVSFTDWAAVPAVPVAEVSVTDILAEQFEGLYGIISISGEIGRIIYQTDRIGCELFHDCQALPG